ncbi:hypothetical protein NOR53_2577 [gamma proteobacterium NOR5-3]|nr:hypothetical protein NOR53_2577 [gamma proteobacterium NOR5-3]
MSKVWMFALYITAVALVLWGTYWVTNNTKRTVSFLLRCISSPILIIPILVSGSTITQETLLPSIAFFFGSIAGLYFLQRKYHDELVDRIESRNRAIQGAFLLAAAIFSLVALYDSFAHVYLKLLFFKVELGSQSINDRGFVLTLCSLLILFSTIGAAYFQRKNEAYTTLFLDLLSAQTNFIAVIVIFKVRDFNAENWFLGIEVGPGFFALVVSGLCISMFVASQKLVSVDNGGSTPNCLTKSNNENASISIDENFDSGESSLRGAKPNPLKARAQSLQGRSDALRRMVAMRYELSVRRNRRENVHREK